MSLFFPIAQIIIEINCLMCNCGGVVPLFFWERVGWKKWHTTIVCNYDTSSWRQLLSRYGTKVWRTYSMLDYTPFLSLITRRGEVFFFFFFKTGLWELGRSRLSCVTPSDIVLGNPLLHIKKALLSIIKEVT